MLNYQGSQRLISKFKIKWFEKGGSFKVFFNIYIKPISKISYRDFLIQINYIEEVTSDIEIGINKYLNKMS